MNHKTDLLAGYKHKVSQT